MDRLVEESGVSRGKIHRIETSAQALLDPDAHALARALGVDVGVLLDLAHAPADGLAEDVTQFDPPPKHPLAGIDRSLNRFEYVARSNALSAIGIVRGDVLLASNDAADVADAGTGQVVILQQRAGSETVNRLRIFVAPYLYVTNAEQPFSNERNLDSRIDDVSLLAVVHSKLQRLGA